MLVKHLGKDMLQTEHLIYSHPILYVILSRLFEQFRKNRFVPASFGQRLLIPTPKDSNKRGILSVDQFRGITISPIISKVFEHCLLLLYKEYMFSSERQFGFKKGIGCSHAFFQFVMKLIIMLKTILQLICVAWTYLKLSIELITTDYCLN